MRENPITFLSRGLIILGGVCMLFFIGFGKQWLLIGSGACFVLSGLVSLFGGKKE